MGSSDIEEFPHIQDPFIEFRAGKMRLEGTRVLPDSRKGLIRVGRGEEGLVHFQWLDRTRNVVEDEPNADRDLLLSSALNLCLKQRTLEDGGEEPFVPQEPSVDMVDDDISSRAGNLVGPSIVAEANSDVTSSGPVKLTDLQRILSNIGSTDDSVDPDAGLGLVDILKPELILPLINDLPVEQQLASYLPEGSWTPHELAELLQSPPFRQQLDSFSYMLRTGQIDLSQFGIDPRNYKLTVPSFLEALEDSVSESEGSRTKTHEPMDEGQ